jgi:hypothetical protein
MSFICGEKLGDPWPHYGTKQPPAPRLAITVNLRVHVPTGIPARRGVETWSYLEAVDPAQAGQLFVSFICPKKLLKWNYKIPRR